MQTIVGKKLSIATAEVTEYQVIDYIQSLNKNQVEDDNKTEIGNDGWNDIADYEIGQTVPYTMSSVIPNINGYHTYYYAWHDVMDEVYRFF